MQKWAGGWFSTVHWCRILNLKSIVLMIRISSPLNEWPMTGPPHKSPFLMTLKWVLLNVHQHHRLASYSKDIRQIFATQVINNSQNADWIEIKDERFKFNVTNLLNQLFNLQRQPRTFHVLWFFGFKLLNHNAETETRSQVYHYHIIHYIASEYNIVSLCLNSFHLTRGTIKNLLFGYTMMTLSIQVFVLNTIYSLLNMCSL